MSDDDRLFYAPFERLLAYWQVTVERFSRVYGFDKQRGTMRQFKNLVAMEIRGRPKS